MSTPLQLQRRAHGSGTSDTFIRNLSTNRLPEFKTVTASKKSETLEERFEFAISDTVPSRTTVINVTVRQLH